MGALGAAAGEKALRRQGKDFVSQEMAVKEGERLAKQEGVSGLALFNKVNDDPDNPFSAPSPSKKRSGTYYTPVTTAPATSGRGSLFGNS